MQYTNLGATGLTVSRLCLGTMTFGLQTEEDQSFEILDKAAAGGVNFLDTADVYPLGGDLGTVGRTEVIIGHWLKGRRHQYVLATKCVGKMGDARWDQGASRKHILDAVDASLQRLGTDYIDLYQLHSDDPNTPLDETIDALDTVVRNGKARYIGVSNFLAYRLARALGRADVKNKTRFVSLQPRYSLLFRETERELLPLAKEEGLGVIPYNPLAGGLLTGKHKPGVPPAGTRFTIGTAGARYQDRYWNDKSFAKIAELRQVVSDAGLNLTTVAIAWVLANPVITSAIIGASRAEQLNDTLNACEMKLDAGLKQKLDELTVEFRRGDAPR